MPRQKMRCQLVRSIRLLYPWGVYILYCKVRRGLYRRFAAAAHWKGAVLGADSCLATYENNKGMIHESF